MEILNAPEIQPLHQLDEMVLRCLRCSQPDWNGCVRCQSLCRQGCGVWRWATALDEFLR
jgi:hypothetical protein